MQNLGSLQRYQCSGSIESSDEATAFTYNSADNTLYVLSAIGHIYKQSVDIKGSFEINQNVWMSLTDTFPMASKAKWKWITYASECNALVVGHEVGILGLVRLDVHHTEEIGVFDSGILAIAWSTAQDMVAIATRSGTLVVLNTQWQVLHETKWSEFTQLVDNDTLVDVQLSWREDSEYIAVNLGFGKCRLLLVLDSFLAFHSVGRKEDGEYSQSISSLIDWCPNHSLIANCKILQNRWNLVFFERNGLAHGEFALPEAYSPDLYAIEQLAWNISSDILAIVLRDLETGKCGVQLWTRENYRWYLKQEIEDYGDSCFLWWDTERPYVLHSLANTGASSWEYNQQEFVWKVDASFSTVGVIDGNKLLVTPFDKVIIPPPFAFKEIVLGNSNINQICFAQDDSAVAALSSDGQIVIVCDYLSSCRTIMCENSSLSPRALLAFIRTAKEGYILLVKGLQESVVLIEYTEKKFIVREESHLQLRLLSHVQSTCSDQIDFMAQDISGGVLALSLEGGKLTCATDALGRGENRFVQLSAIPGSSTHWIGLTAGGRLFYDKILIFTAVTSFMLDTSMPILLVTTSGRPSQLHIISLQALLSVLDKGITKALQEQIGRITEARSIEHGAKLICMVPKQGQVILQAERGNLETLTPCILILLLVIQLLSKKLFVIALETCRKHRLDLNLLVDYDPKAFYNHLDAILEELLAASPGIASDRLCLFITNLHPVNMWLTKYGPQAEHIIIEPPRPASELSKVNDVCNALSHAMKCSPHSANEAFLLPMLTCFIKQQPPQYQEALKTLKALRTDSPAQAKRAIKHLTLLVDVGILYRESLGAYDIELARFIASYSQQDPKEYNSLLDSLEALQIDQRLSSFGRYKVDEALQRSEKAIENLIAHLIEGTDGDHARQEWTSKLVDLVATSHLYDTALDKLTPNPASSWSTSLSKRILLLKAHFLVKDSAEEAAYIYLTLDENNLAVKAFTAAGKWELALSIADSSQTSKARGYLVAEKLLESGSSKYACAAARIYVEYCEDIAGAIMLLIDHKHWQESLRLAYLHDRRDLLQEIGSAILQQSNDLMGELKSRSADYDKCHERMTTIREQKRLFQLHGIDSNRWNREGDSDSQSSACSSMMSSVVDSNAYSDTSNASSRSSVGSHNHAKTSQIGNFGMKEHVHASASHFFATHTITSQVHSTSSKPKRHERRQHRIKTGSTEELQYVEKRLDEVRPDAHLECEVDETIKMLLYLKEFDKAIALQNRLNAFLRRIEETGTVSEGSSTRTSNAMQWNLTLLEQRQVK
uniref:Elongator complex protein 1 n=1 Tax=Albugo laibachii Nc14 TaxID=890382 RepID=F0W1X7_9STRA|nr:elongator complex protein 1 putative [Albugo laibachii Nc14]|eukprot:CCA15056.1 elongator complex protein 1 putative [Albugo laibachii Nc14]